MNDDKFLDEDLDTKPVTDIPGVEEADGEKLKGKGFDKAGDVLSKFLSMKRKKESFIEWLRNDIGMEEENA
ncbi:Barrier-to-autointegration factor, partial [Armadillidium nasatum]